MERQVEFSSTILESPKLACNGIVQNISTAPSQALPAALALIKTNHEKKNSRVSDYLEELLIENPRMASHQDSLGIYVRELTMTDYSGQPLNILVVSIITNVMLDTRYYMSHGIMTNRRSIMVF